MAGGECLHHVCFVMRDREGGRTRAKITATTMHDEKISLASCVARKTEMHFLKGVGGILCILNSHNQVTERHSQRVYRERRFRKEPEGQEGGTQWDRTSHGNICSTIPSADRDS